MTVYGALKIGRVTLTEDPAMSDKAGTSGRSLSLSGQEASPAVQSGDPQSDVRARAEGLLAYEGATVPVVFTHQAQRTGWYRVSSVQADEVTWNDFTGVRWRCDLERLGRDSEVDVESRLTGGNRTHASSASAELWHAPAVGADSYLVGTSTPGTVSRTGVDGAVTVYRAIPALTHPRWSVDAATALLGAVSVTVDGDLLTGTTCGDTPTDWVLSNGLLKVEPRTSAGTLRVTSYLSSGWGTAKVYDVKRGTTSLGAASHVTVLRNDPCECVLRLTWDHAPGRTVADLTLARGSRFASLFVQQYAAPTALRVDDNGAGGTVTNQLTASGYIASTTSDADGNRWVLGTTLAATAAGTFGFAANVAALGLPAFIGCVRGGASPASGDAAADLNAQYLGYPAQAERIIVR